MANFPDLFLNQITKILDPIYLIGGSVRDSLLNRELKDLDIATSLLPDEVELRLKSNGYRVYTVGKRFGTISFYLDNNLVEVTTFRSENYLKQNRKPETQFINSLEDDLARRDFTINAIAYQNGKIYDPLNGYQDLKAKIIRTVGNPEKRFKDDPLRLLRAIRIASELGFEIEAETLKAIKENASCILQISRERISSEFDKILLSENVFSGLRFLKSTTLSLFIFPELSLQSEDIFTDTLEKIATSKPIIENRLAALFSNFPSTFTHKEITSEFILKTGLYFNWSKARIKAVQQICANDY